MELQGVEQNLELISGVCAHLTCELEEQYTPKVSRKGSKINKSGLESAHWDGDEIKVVLTEKSKQFHVRMVLPLFEDNGYSLTVCSCMEDRYLDDQRCSHMWFAQNYILEKLSSKQKSLDSDKSPWLSLVEIMEEIEKVADSNISAPDLPSTKDLVWILSDQLSLSPGFREQGDKDILQKDWNYFFKNRHLWWNDICGLQVFCLLQDKKNEGFCTADFESLTFEILDIICKQGDQIYFSSGLLLFKIEKSDLSFLLNLGDDGLILTPRVPKSLSDHIILGEQDSSGAYVVDSQLKTIFVVSLTLAHRKMLSFLTRHNFEGFFPAQMRREYCVSLSMMQSLRRISYSGENSIEHQARSDENLYFRLTPVEPEGVFLEAFVKPVSSLPYHKFYQIPGEGSDVISDFSIFPPVSFKRSFDLECELFNQVVSELSLQCDELAKSKRLLIRNDYEVIEFLDELQSHSLKSSIFLEWPEEANRIPRKFQIEDDDIDAPLKVSAKKSGDWFDIAGGVWIHGQKIDLLTLVKAYQEKRKFVKLHSGKWFRISDLLKHRIAQIEACLTQSVGGSFQDSLRMSRTQAGLSLQNQDIEFSGDVDFERFKQHVTGPEKRFPEISEDFKADLRPYQKEGVTWLWKLWRWASGAILADDMGLGKTVQTIAFLRAVFEGKPYLILCPSSLCDNWVQEINKFCPRIRTLMFRDTRKELFVSGNLSDPVVVISSYGLLLHDDKELLAKTQWGALVLDEAQALKNSAGKTYRNVARLNSEFTLALSGTPVENRLSDLWSLLNLVTPGLLGSKSDFQKKWSGGSEKDSSDGSEASFEFKRLVRPFILRRTKEAYLRDLPPRTWKNLGIYLSPEERKFYDEKRMQAISELKSVELDEESSQTKKIQILAWLTKLRQIVCHPGLVEPDWNGGSAKEKEFFRLAEKLMNREQKTLVFSQFPSFLEILSNGIEKKGWKTQMLRGSTPVSDRQNLVKIFQDGQIDFFLISLKAGGTGLNLTRAGSVILLDPWWNPAAESQAADRAYRIGQKNPVTIFRMVAQNTIEEKVLSLQETKRKLSEEFIDSSGTDLNQLNQIIGLTD